MGARTARVHAMRGLLAAYGIVVPQGVHAVRKAVREKREAEQAQLTSLSQELFSKLVDEVVQVDSDLAYDDDKPAAIAPSPLEGQRLRTIPGSGPSTATALIAAVSAVGVFTPGRHFAAGWGLVPKPPSTGGQTRL
jgi:transposase